MYDEKELAKRVSKKRKAFLIYFFLDIALLAASITLLILNINETVFFISTIATALSVMFLFTLCNSFSPAVLFSSEIRGKNIKEDVYEVYVRRGFGLSPRQAGMRYGGHPISHTRMAKGRLRSSVYLRLENGDIFEIRGLRVEHTELYEDGDLLCKPAGAKYPIILGRHIERQPCPLCGAINTESADACINCGLKTEK